MNYYPASIEMSFYYIEIMVFYQLAAHLSKSQSAYTCLKLTTEGLEQGVKICSKLAPSSSVSIVSFEHAIAGWGT